MPSSTVEFTSSTQQRITTQEVPMLEPGDITRLPLGNAFILCEGGRLLKTRFPMPDREVDEALPRNIRHMVSSMRKRGPAPERWWVREGWFGANRGMNKDPARPDFAGAEIDTDPMAAFESASTEMGAFSGLEEM